jgi:hypothetical protein
VAAELAVTPGRGRNARGFRYGSGVFSLEELAAHPTYGRLPAVESGQMGPWNQDFIQSYQGLTAALKTMMATLQNAADVTP